MVFTRTLTLWGSHGPPGPPLNPRLHMLSLCNKSIKSLKSNGSSTWLSWGMVFISISGLQEKRGTLKVKLQFSAPSAGIAQIGSSKVLLEFEPRPPDCSGCKVSGLQHGATTPSFKNLGNSESEFLAPQTCSKSYCHP